MRRVDGVPQAVCMLNVLLERMSYAGVKTVPGVERDALLLAIADYLDACEHREKADKPMLGSAV